MIPPARYALYGSLAVVALAGAAGGYIFHDGSSAALDPVTVQLSWTHGAAFAGYYAADQNSEYAARGLQVTFLTGGPRVDPVPPVVEGRARFGTAAAHHLLRARADGKPVRSLACIYRRSPLVFAALADSGIAHPRQFVGKTIRLGRQNIQILYAMMAQFDVASDRYTVVETNDPQEFYSGKVDIWGGFLIGSVRDAVAAGHELSIIFPDDFRVHGYHECLFTTDEVIAAEPQLVARFLGATLMGWRFVVDHPDEVGSMVVGYDPGLEAATEIAEVRASRPLFNTGENHIGWMRPEIWAAIAASLQETGGLPAPLDVTQVYTMQFLTEFYEDGA